MSRSSTPIEQRFWPKVDKAPGHGPRGDCWLWTAYTKPNGYGVIGRGGRGRGMEHAHRLAFEIANGRPPRPGMDVCHSCDVRHCVNPAHLWEGTRAENLADMDRKGRRRSVATRGESSPNAKLTRADVLLIRSSVGPRSMLAIAFGVSPSLIRAIQERRCWAWLEEGKP